MIQLTEKEARELFSTIWQYPMGIIDNDITIKKWKIKGWIKKTALEELNEYIGEISEVVLKQCADSYYSDLQADKLKDLIKRVIEELQGEKDGI